MSAPIIACGRCGRMSPWGTGCGCQKKFIDEKSPPSETSGKLEQKNPNTPPKSSGSPTRK